MKTTITIVFTLLLTSVYGQADNYKTFLDSAKNLFKVGENLNPADYDKFDYDQIVSLLDRAIELNPQSSEARYFLGYTYDRINSRDGRGIIDMDLQLLYKTSEQFEKVIELTPKYSDEIIMLDPYSKLSAEWGAMAMRYLFNNKTDSARWAFREGKKRGGFGNFILELNKSVLDACSKNAILISSGDNFSIPLWYLQVVENYRTDVSVVDISLLNSIWYPAFLSGTNTISFDLPGEVLDNIDHTSWTDTTIKINNFSWIVKPSYEGGYLLRGDKLFLSILKQNKFQRDLYFTVTFKEENRLSLTDYISPRVFVDKLTVSKKLDLSYAAYKKTISKALKLSEHLTLNSQDEVILLDIFRYDILRKVNDFLTIDDKKKAKELMEIMDKFAHEKKYPFHDQNVQQYVDFFRQKI